MSQQSDDWRIKLRSQIRKQNINMLAWQENNPNPMTDEECEGLIDILKSLTEKSITIVITFVYMGGLNIQQQYLLITLNFWNNKIF